MSNQQKTSLIRYQYDALDRLISDRRPESTDRQRFYCDSRLVTETEGGEQISILQQGDQLLAEQRRHSDWVDCTLLATDQQRSVLNVLQERPTKAIAYTPYGHRPSENGLSSLLGFNGQRSDPVTGHYFLGNGYRAFNPVLMRFNSPDNASPFGKGGVNPYAYCLGDPMNRSDSSGHISKLLLMSGAREMSNLLGYNVKPIENLKRLTAGIGAFDDSYKGGSRITLMGHGSGSPGEYLLTAGDGVFVDAKGLVSLAEKNKISFKDYDSVRLLICHSAESGANGMSSFAQQFSNTVELPVKAFVGEVGGKATRVPLVGHGVEKTYIDYFGVFKKPATLKKFGGRNAYSPVKFQTEKLGKVNSDIRA
jgi:RHS repeat-associated protein